MARRKQLKTDQILVITLVLTIAIILFSTVGHITGMFAKSEAEFRPSVPVRIAVDRSFETSEQRFGVMASSSAENWTMFRYDLNNTGYTNNTAPSNISIQFANFATGNDVQSSPAVAGGFVYIGSWDNQVYQLNASNISQKIANFSTGDDVRSSPAVAGGFVYIGSDDNQVYQLNASNISQKIANFSTGDRVQSSPAVAGGFVYIGSRDDQVYQLNASNISQKIANFSTGNNVLSSPAVAGGFVYIGSDDDQVYQLNASNISQKIANFSTGNNVHSSPAVAGGFVYIGSFDDQVYQLNASNVSQLIANFSTGSNVFPSPAVAGGFVYIGSDDGYVYQLGTGIAAASESTDPIVTLLTPANLATETSSTVSFTYSVTDDSTVSNCSLIIDNNIEQTDTSITKSTTQTFTQVGLFDDMTYHWYINCTDQYGNRATTTAQTLYVDTTPTTVVHSGGRSSATSKISDSDVTTIAETSQILGTVSGNTPVSINLKDPEIAVSNVEITTREAAKNAMITVRSLSGKPEAVQVLEGKVYQYLSISTNNLATTNIQNGKITFKVPASWLSQNNVNKDSILMYRYVNNQWTALRTSIVIEDEEHLTFEANTEGFSYFAITGEEEIAVAPELTHEPESIVQQTIRKKSFFTPLNIALILISLAAILFIIYGQMRPKKQNKQAKKSRK